MTGTGGTVTRTVLDTGTGLVRRLVEVPAGACLEAAAGPGGELWFALAGAGRLQGGAGGAWPVECDTGVWLPPGSVCRLHGEGPGTLRLDGVALPAGGVALPGGGAGQRATRPGVRRLRDCPEEVTGDRRFRVLFGPGQGCEAATQFVGEIPPGRAPQHSHPYDEVVLVLAGSGLLHAGAAVRELGPGGCAHLPPGQPHCLENTGRAVLRVLGVFCPGGSPAVKRVTR